MGLMGRSGAEASETGGEMDRRLERRNSAGSFLEVACSDVGAGSVGQKGEKMKILSEEEEKGKEKEELAFRTMEQRNAEDSWRG